VNFAPSTTWTTVKEEAFQKDCQIDDLDPSKENKIVDNVFRSSFTVNNRELMMLNTNTRGGEGEKPVDSAMVTTTGTSRRRNIPSSKRTTASRAARSISPDKMNNNNIITSHDLFTSNHEPDATITINLIQGTCLVEDYEFNTFDITLNCPPTVSTSGTATDHQSSAAELKGVDEANNPLPSTTEQQPDDNNNNNPTNNENQSIVGDHHSVVSEKSTMNPMVGGVRQSPLDVIVQLAGEVPGLKPPAVARSPKPPRIFILNRSGDATEVVKNDVSFFFL
jgi:hypothetical protein